jgi:hypothetical protein
MSDKFAAYRAQITAIDLLHTGLTIAVVLLMVFLSGLGYMLNSPKLFLLVPFLAITLLGIIARMTTMIHRIGGFLKAWGDPWEIAKADHKPTRYLMPLSDLLALAPVFPLVCEAEHMAWNYFAENPEQQVFYLVSTLFMLIVGLFGVILATIKAKTGFENVKPE